jgi:hypothetical protein
MWPSKLKINVSIQPADAKLIRKRSIAASPARTLLIETKFPANVGILAATCNLRAQ